MTTSTIRTDFGTFIGKNEDGVVQFLGIKYAELEDQLCEPRMKRNYGRSADHVVDATSFGPQAPPIIKDGCAFEQSILIQCTLGPNPEVPMSGTECLNLNITMPGLPSPTSSALPVMVFIHGGGFVMGANYWPQYDPSRLVKMSADIGMPVIVVNINYRLGILGNLTSEELRTIGYPGNNSLRDQRCALQWIRAHISAFGGNAENITAFGESAGAVSVLHHLTSKEPLFKRAISMSGTPLMLKALSLSAAESSYTQIMRALDIENATMEERLHRLLTMSPEELVERTPKHVTLTPFLDGDIIPSLPSFSHGKTMPTKNWCEDILLGSTAHDGAIFHFMGLAERAAGIARALQRSFSANMSPASIDAVLNVYGITPSTPDEEAMAKIIDLATDIAYYLPAVSYFRASSAKAKAHLYAFNEPNPWEGTFKGKSTHILDAAFLFLNFEDQMKGQEVKATGRKLAADFIGFANGIWKQEGETRVYGPKGEGRSDLGKLSMEGKVDLDELSRAWDLFVLGN